MVLFTKYFPSFSTTWNRKSQHEVTPSLPLAAFSLTLSSGYVSFINCGFCDCLLVCGLWSHFPNAIFFNECLCYQSHFKDSAFCVLLKNVLSSPEVLSCEGLFLGRWRHFWLSKLDYGSYKHLTVQQRMI